MKITNEIKEKTYEMFEDGMTKGTIASKLRISRTSVNNILAEVEPENDDNSSENVANSETENLQQNHENDNKFAESAKMPQEAAGTIIKCNECGTENAIQNMLKYQDLAWYDQPLFFYNEKNPFCPECKEEIDLDKGDDKERQEEEDWF